MVTFYLQIVDLTQVFVQNINFTTPKIQNIKLLSIGGCVSSRLDTLNTNV